MDTVPFRRGFTLIELLVVIAIISVIAGLLVPTLLTGRRESYKIQCTNNLRQIGTFAMTYSDKSGTRCFPFAKTKDSRAHESLKELLALYPGELPPELFKCQESPETFRAERAEDGSYVLGEENLSYTWVARRTKPTVNSPLASYRYVDGFEDEDGVHAGHNGGMNVLWTDGPVRFMLTENRDPETMLPPGLTH